MSHKKKKPHRKNCPDKDNLSAAYKPCLNATTTRESLFCSWKMLAYWSCFSGVVSPEISWIQADLWAARVCEGCSACAGEVLMTQGSDTVWWALRNTACLWYLHFVSSTQGPLWKFSWISAGQAASPPRAVCTRLGLGCEAQQWHSHLIPLLPAPLGLPALSALKSELFKPLGQCWETFVVRSGFIWNSINLYAKSFNSLLSLLTFFFMLG